jgi:regulator of sigma E protease
MSTAVNSRTRVVNGIFWVALLAGAVYLISKYVGVVSNTVIVLLGFGAVVLVHEFGHFLVAKLSGIKVESFSIFMPPTLVGIRKTKAGFRYRFLPTFLAEKGEEPEEAAEETEYRIGVFPFGGYVKLLGQEDTGPVKQIDDPRSFARKPVSIRIAVIAAGVTFNVISAAIIFVIVFLVGIRLPPAVVGGVVPKSPAAKAGLQPGDEILRIDGKSEDLDFSNILIAAALSKKDEPVPVIVRHPDGTTERTRLVAENMPGGSFREFGILQPLSLKVARIAEPNVLRERTGLAPGDRIVAAAGRELSHYWEFTSVVEDTLTPSIQVTAERPANGSSERVQTQLPLEWTVTRSGEVESDADLNHIYSMVPRVLVTGVDTQQGQAAADREKRSLSPAPDDTQHLRPGDIILAAARTSNPTYKELRDITAQYEDTPLPIQVLRTDPNGRERVLTVTVQPRRDPKTDRVVIGFLPALDARHAIVAKTISIPGGPAALEIPRGARILSVNGRPVSSFYDVLAEVRRQEGQAVTLEYQLDNEARGGVTLPATRGPEAVSMKSELAESVPVEPLERLYQATGPANALGMGYRRTWTFIAQTYITLKRLLGGLISPKNLMGPVGIITFSYRIVAEQPLVNYAYFLGLISATIAVINFLPLPPFDGGLVILMLIEKVKGSALSERTQGIVAYAGWVMVLILLVYVTFNDIVRSFFS